MGRMMPLDCEICKGTIDYGDFGSENEYENKPTCTCYEWTWNEEEQWWDSKAIKRSRFKKSKLHFGCA